MFKRYDIISIAAILTMFVTALIGWQQVPDSFPVHWNTAGEVDRYGNKFEGLLLMPLLAIGLYLLFFFLPKIDPKRKDQDPTLLAIIRLLIILSLVVIYFTTVAIALGYNIPLNRIIAFSLGTLFLLLGNVMPKVQSNWFIGIRTPWTLQSEHSWFLTHRLAGWIMSIGGLLSIICSLFLPAHWLFIPMIALGVVLLLLIPYSYLMWENDPNIDRDIDKAQTS